MTNPLYVSEDKWRDAIKFLMGLGTSSTLTPKDQRKLRECMRGPFAQGMSATTASRTLQEVMGWAKGVGRS